MSVDEGDSDIQAVIPRRRLWPVLVVAVVLIGAIAATALILSRRPVPLRVLVAIDVGGQWWEGSRPAALVSDQLAARLERFGFEPVKSGDPEVTATLEDAASIDDAARKLRAGFVVSGRLVPEISEEPVPGGYFEARVEAPVALARTGEAPAEAGRVTSWSAATTKDKALEVIAESLGDKAFDVLVLALMAHPSVREILGGQDAAAKAPLLRGEGYVTGRREKLEGAEKSYSELSAKRTAGEQLKGKVAHHGSFDRVVALAGATKEGFVAKSAEIQRFVSPDSGELGYAVGADRLYVLAEPGGERVLFRGHPIQGYPGVAPEGAPIAFVQDLLGRARVLSTLDANGRRTRIRVEDKRFFSEPKLSPGGKSVALWERACRGCPAGLLVIAAAGGKELHKSPGDAAALGGFTWLGPDRLALLERPKPPEPKPEDAKAEPDEAGDAEKPKPMPQRIVLVDLSAAPARQETIYAAGDEWLSAPSASRNGRLIALAREADDGKSIAVLDVETRKLTAFDVGAADNPQLSPNGELVAFEHAGDIVALELLTGKKLPLTKSASIERYPVFSLDGSRVFFEVRDDDPVFPRRAVSVIGTAKLR
jgi:hypothetical protein